MDLGGHDIIAGAIGAFGMIVAATIGWFSTVRERHRRKQSESEMSLQMAALDFSDFLAEWHDTHGEILKLMERTTIDRFLILRAWNGRLTPRWTTAIYQLREGDQQSFSYVHYELDQDYVDRLRHISVGGELKMTTEQLPECGIKEIYKNEGVKEAVWLELEQRWVPGTESRAITYCTFATHDPEGISDDTVTQCKILAGRLKGVAMAFGSGD